MTTPFGPQLIGETEKTLGALLDRALSGTDLDERQWVVLRLAGQLDGPGDEAQLAATARERAHFDDADQLVGALTARGLLQGGRLSRSGREVVGAVQAEVADRTAPIWEGLPAADVDATERVLNEVVRRARTALG